MKKRFFIYSFVVVAFFFAPSFTLNVNSYTREKNLAIPQPVLRAAEQWACDHGVLPETPLPDRVWATYTQMSSTTWEVHWFWIKGGIADDVRLLIHKKGAIISETW